MLGRFEESILLALLAAKAEATTTDIYDALLQKLTKVSPGAIYTALDRMIDKGFVTRRKGEPSQERGGKARYYHKITSGGRSALIDSQNITASWPTLAEMGLSIKGNLA